jgi:hypothetical protein
MLYKYMCIVFYRVYKTIAPRFLSQILPFCVVLLNFPFFHSSSVTVVGYFWTKSYWHTNGGVVQNALRTVTHTVYIFFLITQKINKRYATNKKRERENGTTKKIVVVTIMLYTYLTKFCALILRNMFSFGALPAIKKKEKRSLSIYITFFLPMFLKNTSTFFTYVFDYTHVHVYIHTHVYIMTNSSFKLFIYTN